MTPLTAQILAAVITTLAALACVFLGLVVFLIEPEYENL